MKEVTRERMDAFRVFRGKKQSFFAVAPFPRSFGLEPATLSHHRRATVFKD